MFDASINSVNDIYNLNFYLPFSFGVEMSEENSNQVLVHESTNSSTSTSQTPTPVGETRLSSVVTTYKLDSHAKNSRN